MRVRTFAIALIPVVLAVAPSAGARLSDEPSVQPRSSADTQAAAGTAVAPGRVIRTRRTWQCNGSLRRYGRLPIKVVSRIRNPGRADAIKLFGCFGDGNPSTVDLILDVRGNRRGIGTGYDAVKIGHSAHDLVITGRANCGRRAPGAHQDGVQVMSGRRIKFRDFRSGAPRKGWWTCWGAGGGFFVAHVQEWIPYRVVCVRCRIANYNQSMRIHDSIRSGARYSIFSYVRAAPGLVIGPEAVRPVNVRNRVIRH
jgi:hypothetical protein